MDNRKNVLIVNHNAGTVHHGPNLRSYYVGRSLLAHGFRVTIACSSFSHKLKMLPQVDGACTVEDVDGVRMAWLKTPPYHSAIGRLRSYLCFFLRLRLLYDLIPGPLAVVICSSPPPYWIFFCRRFARRKRARLIFEARDLWPDVLLERFRTAAFNPAVWLMAAAERLAYRCCDAVVAVNPEARPVMERRGLASGKFIAIGSGVFLDSDETKEELVPAIAGRIPAGAGFCLGYAGTLNRIIGLEYFIEAARMLERENIHFILAGDGPAGARLRRQAAGLANVTFLGWIPKRQLFAFLTRMDAAFNGWIDLPALAIGSDPAKLGDYMRAGCAVIYASSARSSIVLESACGLQVRPEDPQAIADAVLKLRSLSQAERRRMGAAGREYLARHRSYEVLGKKWADLLDSLTEWEPDREGAGSGK